MRTVALPLDAPPAPCVAEEGRSFLAMIEVARFEGLKRTVGHGAAVRLLGSLADQIGRHLPGTRSARADRSLIELVFSAPTQELAEAALAMLAIALAQRVELEGYGFDVEVAIGFVRMRDGAVGDEQVGAAERALAAARRAQPPIMAAGADLRAESIDRLTLLRALQRAIRDDALSLHYQPKIAARTGEIVAVEALLRWSSPTLGIVTPDMFVPLAEETGDIRALTEWVIGRAARDQAVLIAAGLRPRIDINISGESLGDERFTRRLIAQVADAPGAIGFEITETSMIDDPVRALANLRLCAEAGIGLAIDDYGSGFSSLAYLQRLPVEELKIDRAFVSRLASHQRDPLLVRSTIDLAHALEMRVTAEGIESAHVLALLQVMGCDLLQGYHLARPMPLDALIPYLAGDAARAIVRTPTPRFAARPSAAAAG